MTIGLKPPPPTTFEQDTRARERDETQKHTNTERAADSQGEGEQDDQDAGPSEGFWREFFLLKPDRASLRRFLDELTPTDLLQSEEQTRELFSRSVTTLRGAQGVAVLHALDVRNRENVNPLIVSSLGRCPKGGWVLGNVFVSRSWTLTGARTSRPSASSSPPSSPRSTRTRAPI